MRILLLDDVPDPVFQALVVLKIQTVKFTTLSPDENNDKKVIKVANDHEAIILTMDRDFTNEPLFPAMAECNSCVVRLRPPKIKPPKTPKDLNADLAMMILRDRHRWEDLFDQGSGVVSCDFRGSRIKFLKDFPWYKENINGAEEKAT